MKNTIQSFWSKIKKTNTCWIWQGSPGGTGYGQFGFNGKLNYPHRFSYELHKGLIPKDLFVCHSCDNKLCVNPSHLWLGTLQDNHSDMMKKGRHNYGKSLGSKNPAAKLSEQDVLDIRSLPGPNWRIAKQYNVSKSTIDEIKTRRTWNHI